MRDMISVAIAGIGEPCFNIGIISRGFLLGLPGEIVLVFLCIFLAGFVLAIDPLLDAGCEPGTVVQYGGVRGEAHFDTAVVVAPETIAASIRRAAASASRFSDLC